MVAHELTSALRARQSPWPMPIIPMDAAHETRLRSGSVRNVLKSWPSTYKLYNRSWTLHTDPDRRRVRCVLLQGWVVHRVTFFPRKHFCRLKSSQLCSPAPVDGIRAQDRSFSCTSASVPFRGPETDPRSVLGWSEITEIVTRSSGDPVQQDVVS